MNAPARKEEILKVEKAVKSTSTTAQVFSPFDRAEILNALDRLREQHEEMRSLQEHMLARQDALVTAIRDRTQAKLRPTEMEVLSSNVQLGMLPTINVFSGAVGGYVIGSLQNLSVGNTMLGTISMSPSALWRDQGVSKTIELNAFRGFPTTEQSNSAPENTTPPGVSLPTLVQLGGLFVGAACIASLVIWLLGLTPPVNPFVSLLLLVASPFFFIMGRLARRELQQREL